MRLYGFIGMLILLGSALHAQGGSSYQVPPGGDNEPGSNAEVNPNEESPKQNSGASLRSILSANDFDIFLGGDVEFELEQSERQDGQGNFSAPSNSRFGLDLDKFTLNLGIHFRDDIRAYSEFEVNEDGAFLDEAYVTFINPLIGFELVPRLSDDVHDSLLIGLEDPFWRNNKRVSESHSLLQESLARDERLQFLYTLTLFDRAYMMAGFGNGLELALDGSVDETENHPLLQDDRGDHFAGVNDEETGSRELEALLGFGVVFDLKPDYESSVFPDQNAFRPMDLQRYHKDFAHVGFWFSHDRLSANEQALLSDISGDGSRNEKWRLGLVAESVYDFETSVVAARFEYAHAVDGALRRDFWSVEASVTLPIARFRYAESITPFMRLSGLTTNHDGPRISSTSLQGDINTALIVADREQITLGASVEISRSIRLIFEYTYNDEDFQVVPGLTSDVANDLYLLALHMSW